MRMRAYALLLPLMAGGLPGQGLTTSLEADLVVEPIPGHSTDVRFRFQFRSPYDLALGYAKASVTPEARLMGGTAYRREPTPAGSHSLSGTFRLPCAGDYEVAASVFSLHPANQRILAGTRRSQWVRLAKDGVRLVDAPGSTAPACYTTAVKNRARVKVLTPGESALFTLQGGRPVRYMFTSRAGELIALGVRCDQLDTRLALYGPDGRMLAASDDQDGWNPRIPPMSMIELPKPGTHSVMVEPFSDAGGGSCELLLRAAPAP